MGGTRNIGHTLCIVSRIVAAVLSAWLITPEAARAAAPDEKDWRLAASLYGWMSSVSGDVNRAGENQKVHASYGDIIDKAERGLQWSIEAGWREWFAAADGYSLDLKETHNIAAYDLDLGLDLRIYHIRAGYCVFKRHVRSSSGMSLGRNWRRFAQLDVYVGARYFSNETTVTATDLNTGEKYDQLSDTDHWDPVFGARCTYTLTDRWVVAGRGDVGGFNIGSAAKFSWLAEGNVGLRLFTTITAFGGYRAIGYVLGDDAESNETDITLYGPRLGLALTF